MSPNRRDELDKPHHFTEGQLLRRAFACLALVGAILFFAYKCEAQTIETKRVTISSDGCNTCTLDTQTGTNVCTALWCGPQLVIGTPVRQSAVALKAAISSYMALSVVDAGQTHRCLSAGICREANPLLKPFSGSPSGLVAVKLAANSGVAYGIWKLHKRKPKTALVLGIAAAGFQAVVVGVNARRR